MNNFRIPFFLVLSLIIVSCGSRRTTSSAIPTEDAAAAAVIKSHYDNQADFETLQGRLRLQFQSESRNQSATVSFRMKKNDTIWMSGQLLGIPLAKVMMTQERVQFYEKISGKYFDGDFRLLSDLLGTPLDYEKVQNLLLGQTIYSLKEEEFELDESSQGYQLSPVEDSFLKKLFLLDASHFQTLAQQISQENAGRSVTVTYPVYQDINGQAFPKEIRIIANEASGSTQVDIDFRSIEFDVPIDFPFSIPSGYEEIIIE